MDPMNELYPDLIQDITEMHRKFGVNEKIRELTPEILEQYILFRTRFLHEELIEAFTALDDKTGDWRADYVDANIDLIVVALGNLNALDVNTELAWRRVHAANMAKEPGVKPSRPNPFGLPDLIKPEGWVAPDHSDNVGLLSRIEDRQVLTRVESE